MDPPAVEAAARPPRRCVQSKLLWARTEPPAAGNAVPEAKIETKGRRRKTKASIAQWKTEIDTDAGTEADEDRTPPRKSRKTRSTLPKTKIDSDTGTEAGENQTPPRKRGKARSSLRKTKVEIDTGTKPDENGPTQRKRGKTRLPRPKKIITLKRDVHTETGNAIEVDEQRSKEKRRKKTNIASPKPKISRNYQDLNGGIVTHSSSAGGKRSRPLKNNYCGGVSPAKDNMTNACNGCNLLAKHTPKKGKSSAKGNVDISLSAAAIDLRAEEKKAAEENAQFSAGKQLHPFFANLKSTKKTPGSPEIVKFDGRSCLVRTQSIFISSPPIHVFDTRTDTVFLDWRNWSFTERISADYNGYCSGNNSAFEDLVLPLNLDALSNKKSHSDQFLVEVNGSVSLLSNCSSAKKISDCHLDEIVNESHLSDCSMWTKKYMPNAEIEVRGNLESVRYLSKWLNTWHKGEPKSSKYVKSCTTADSDSDMSDMDESILNNVLLILGPIGSGKSAAVYACAKELGFEVIEVNTSESRSGLQLKQRFGEGLEMHNLGKWPNEKTASCRRKIEFISSQLDGMEAEDYDNSSLEGNPRKTDDGPIHAEIDRITYASSPIANKSLILFEDVDTVFEEDRGFISSIVQLAETSVRPIILTSNNKNPNLPQVFRHHVLCFRRPCFEELFPYISKVCDAEKVLISSQLLRQIIILCLGDIRKTIMLLQFWCQGAGSKVEKDTDYTYSPLRCDIDAAHLAIQRIIPWGFPCKLSEKVESEIHKTVSAGSEKLSFEETVNHGAVEGDGEAGSAKGKKKRGLKMKPLPKETSHYTSDLEDFYVTSESQVAQYNHIAKRRKIILPSSPSDDEFSQDNPPLSTPVEATFHSLPDTHTVQPDHTSPAKKHIEPLISPFIFYGRNATTRDHVGFEASHLSCTISLQDESFVPETIFTSENECLNKDVNQCTQSSSDHVCFSPTRPLHILPDIGYNNFCEDTIQCAMSPRHVDCVNTELINGHKMTESSPHDTETHQPNECHVMDECSRVAFSMPRVLLNNSCFSYVDWSLEAWKKINSQSYDLKDYLASDHKDVSSVVKLSSSVTDLISAVDVMYSGCHPYLSDNLGPSTTPCVEPDDLSWYERQCEIGSTFAQHGMCMYINKCAMLGSNLGFLDVRNMAEEMLASSTDAMAFGKLITHEDPHSEMHAYELGHNVSTRDCESKMYGAVAPIVPIHTLMSLSGLAFHDYLSSVSQISKLDSRRIDGIGRRRSRTRHYLRSGKLQLSPKHVEMLNQSFCFKNVGL